MEAAQAKRILEGIIFVFGQPVPLKRIQEVLPLLDTKTVRQLVKELNDEYAASRRAFQIQEVAGGFQIMTEKDIAPWVKRALERPRPDSVSVASMETLAIIAYRQPLTKAEIEAIRGVDVGGSLETLSEKQFIRTAGRKDSPGRPFLYATTNEFLRHFGLKSLEALPEMKLPQVPEYPEPVGAAPEAGTSPRSGVVAEAGSSPDPALRDRPDGDRSGSAQRVATGQASSAEPESPKVS